MNPTIYLLSREGSQYGGWVLQSAIQAGMQISGVLLQQWGREQKIKRLKFYVKKYGLFTTVFSKFLESIDRCVLAQKTDDGKIEDVLRNVDIPVYPISTLNGKETLAILDQHSPDVLLLGGVGIVTGQVISRINLGVMNAHPGSLPKYKGSYVVRWALLAGDPIEISVHKVDVGIDTGKVISCHKVQLPKIRSLVGLESYVDRLRAEYLVRDTCLFLEKEILPKSQSMDSSKTYSIMPPLPLLRTYYSVMSDVKSKSG